MVRKYAIALGFFDGVHVGHGALIKRACEIAEEKGLTPAVLTFDTHPMSKITGVSEPMLTSEFDREGVLEREFGVKDVIVLPFDDEMMRMHWKSFAEYIIEKFSAAYLICGHDYTFGYKGEGKAEMLKEICDEHGIGCDVIPAVLLDGVRVSSTLIRNLIAEGEIEKANRNLGHAHVLTDIVRDGKHLGRTIGSPTVNMQFEKGVIVPRHGVYATKVYLEDGSVYSGVTNVGVRPTVEDTENVNAETYILNYSGDLYGKRVRIEFYKFVRPEMKFGDVSELKAQIQRDAAFVDTYFNELK
ncbi:MAG: bifunctional riboflavin kinase/FAD synthetase [Oscillospiraceae bacterium]|nr:bifunctional riboflavin kinase/FAD synthetase [Oscillospiraceae bacterium]